MPVVNLDVPTKYLIPGNSFVYGAENHLEVTADMTSATWNTVATHELFTVTGCVQMKILARCTDTLTDATNTATITLGTATDPDGFILSTTTDDLITGELWYDATPTTTFEATPTCLLDYTVNNGDDIGYEIAGEALTGGTMVFSLVWYPMSSDAMVVAGAGGSL